ncbi:TetR family transcriptional regulator [uncultured Enterococcus sp.]|uniref:TetR family transcriptional regulator n=1 Tax=uncultured Enterococcus sp. TaxID=167972 RepID=UPI002AA64635|nr:TetR family transcriptional regulator [uncultured Enterococcus sp.]
MDTKLSREKIIEAAFQLLEETPDIEKLSMRNIAKRIGVQAPALYWYFQNKQALLQSMAEEIEQHFETPEESSDWKQTLFSYMENYYDLYLKFPCALEIEMNTIPSSSLRLTRYNTMLGILRTAGFSIEASYTAVNGLQHLLFGLLIDISEEKQLYNKIFEGDKYLNQQVVLMKQYVTDNELTYVEESFAYRQQKKQKDTFKRMITLFLDSLDGAHHSN